VSSVVSFYSKLIYSLAFLFVAAPLQAEIYKWVDVDGTVHYTDTPPEGREQSLEITGRISSYSSPEIIATDAPEGGADKKSTPGKGKRVVMYSAPWCGVCRTAKKYFAANNIPYTEYDIDNDARARTDFEKMGGRGVPVILVGASRMNGFSAGGFEKLYRAP
jgi:glutaredoxin